MKKIEKQFIWIQTKRLFQNVFLFHIEKDIILSY